MNGRRIQFQFRLNAASVIALALVVVLAIAFVQSRRALATEREARSIAERQLRGELTDAERRFQEADLARGLAESKAIKADEFARFNEKLVHSLRKDLKNNEIELDRISRARFELTETVRDMEAQVEHTRIGDTIAYRFSLPWFSFFTPNVLGKGNEEITFDVLFELAIEGVTLRGGILQSERVRLLLTDRDGNPIPIQPVLASYRFEYAAEAPPESPWWSAVHLDLFGGVSTPYPWSFNATRAGIGIEASIFGVTLGLIGEARLDGEYTAYAIAGYRWRAF